MALPENVAQAAVDQATTDAIAKAAVPAVVGDDSNPEAAALAAAEAELAAVEAGTTGAVEQPAAAGDPTTSQPTTAPDAGAGATAADPATAAAPLPAGDPRDRALIAFRRQNKALALENARLEGEKRVYEDLVNRGIAPANDIEPELTPQQQIEAIDGGIMELAQKLEAGELKQPEYEQARLQLMDQRDDLRHAIRNPAITETAVADAAPVASTDTAVQDHLNGLLEQHPYLKTMSQEQLNPYHEAAMQELQTQGKLGFGNRSDMALRERMAEMVRADRFRELGIADPLKTSGKPAAVPAQRQAAALDKKLELAATHPANVARGGTGATGVPLDQAQALATLNSFNGNEDAALAWLKANPGIAAI